MAVEGVSPALAIRSSAGIELWASSGLKKPFEPKANLPREETKNSRSTTFSPDGRYFAFSNGVEVKILSTCDWQTKCSLPRPKAFYLKFSPRGNYLSTWESFAITKDKPEGAPNLYVYEVETGNEVYAVVQKKQTDWEPSWSSNESLFALVVGGEALFYDLGGEGAGFTATSKKIGGGRNGILSVGPGNSPPYLAFYTPGAKGAPSMCKLYKYPALQQAQTIACKSFFQADRVEMLWNKRGTGVLLLTSTEVDKSGASYYGNQAVHFMSTKGDTCSVPLSKEGPVHAVKWSPKATEFVVVYGYMPSKASLYNLKCDVIFNFGEAPRNCAYFNDFGNLLILAGFGNLRGYIEMWDVAKKKKITDMQAPDSTLLEWNPDGETFVTATTAPRLRIGNGFKIWHYCGALLHETVWPKGQELLGVEWQRFADGVFKEKSVSEVKFEGIKPSQPEASKQAYQPPHFRLLKEGKDPEKLIPQPSATLPDSSGKKKGTQNSRQKKPNPKTKKEPSVNGQNVNGVATAITSENDANNGATSVATPNANANANKKRSTNNQKQQQQQKPNPESEAGAGTGADNGAANEDNKIKNDKRVINSEKEKKVRHVAKKLADIKKLKMRQDQGNVLELNQLNKISMEAKFLEELKALKLSN
ncbi:eukaryotic translation initiation factor 2A [Eupeodes corollae]|uniref:eukaryotic translation initiation factor 2A n=1 Tax=Eupeodes corollae TaxID=290404 RepID=UPI00248F4C3F|nr:eukaryotic translation initiation factor 2A [Eupeodes corollae]